MDDYEYRLNTAINNMNLLERLIVHYLTAQDPSQVRINNPFKQTNIR